MHTPGLWNMETYDPRIKGKDPVSVFSKYHEICKVNGQNGLDADANARLIADAPALLAAATDAYHDAAPLSKTRGTLGPILLRLGMLCECWHKPHTGACGECGHITFTKAAGKG